jgi:hypothetical protein
MRYDVYAWSAPRDLSVEDVVARIEAWEAEGGDPAKAPFEPSSDVAGFYRELEHDMREIAAFEIVADAGKHTGRGPVWLQTDPPPPAHVAAIRLPRTTEVELAEALNLMYGTATKFDLLFLDANQRVIHQPLQEMATYASATFWPSGAIRAVIAGGAGLVAAIVAYLLGIPIVSGIVIIIGLFLFVLSVATLVSEARKRGRPRTG